MADPDVGAHLAPSRTFAHRVPGFDLGRVVDEDELGVRYLAREQSTGLARTVRVVAIPLTPGQRDDLRRL